MSRRTKDAVSPAVVQQTRRQAAELVREIRAMWPGLKGGWTRRQWNDQARKTGQRYLERTIHFHLFNKE